jgi:hypothetical protein
MPHEQSQCDQTTDREAELAVFRSWYATFDAQGLDRRFEADVQTGKLDRLSEKALRAHTSSRSTKL